MGFSFPYGYGGSILKSDTTKISADKNLVWNQGQSQSWSNWATSLSCSHDTSADNSTNCPDVDDIILLTAEPQRSCTHLQAAEMFGSFWLQFSPLDLQRDLFTTMQCNTHGRRRYLAPVRTSKASHFLKNIDFQVGRMYVQFHKIERE